MNDTNSLHYIRCKQCGFEKQIIDDEALPEYFNKAQALYYEEDDLSFLPSVKLLNARKARKRIKVMKKYLDSGQLLEIGPGSGEFLVEAISSGYNVESIEASIRFVDYINKVLKVKSYEGTIEKFDQKDKSYDGIYSSHVIEHVVDPLRHLETARKLVREGGYLFMATPNADCWEHNVAKGAWAMYTTAHLQIFTPKSIALCLEKAGWEIVDVETLEFTEDWIRVLISLVQGNDTKATVAGKRIRNIPFWLFFVFSKITNIVLLPLSFLQSTFKKGGDIYIIARRPKE